MPTHSLFAEHKNATFLINSYFFGHKTKQRNREWVKMQFQIQTKISFTFLFIDNSQIFFISGKCSKPSMRIRKSSVKIFLFLCSIKLSINREWKGNFFSFSLLALKKSSLDLLTSTKLEWNEPMMIFFWDGACFGCKQNAMMRMEIFLLSSVLRWKRKSLLILLDMFIYSSYK